jgi:cytochrome c oxidase subunit 1
MLIQGMYGVSRRLADGGATYDFAGAVGPLNRMTSWSAWGLALAQIPFVINFFLSMKRGKQAGRNPWQATTLEWQAPSPPPHGNFEKTPLVTRGPYEYSVPGEENDFCPQNQPVEA